MLTPKADNSAPRTRTVHRAGPPVSAPPAPPTTPKDAPKQSENPPENLTVRYLEADLGENDILVLAIRTPIGKHFAYGVEGGVRGPKGEPLPEVPGMTFHAMVRKGFAPAAPVVPAAAPAAVAAPAEAPAAPPPPAPAAAPEVVATPLRADNVAAEAGDSPDVPEIPLASAPSTEEVSAEVKAAAVAATAPPPLPPKNPPVMECRTPSEEKPGSSVYDLVTSFLPIGRAAKELD